MTDTPYGPKGPRGRGRRLIRPLRAAAFATLVLAAVGAVAPDATGRTISGVLVGVLVAVPVVRIAFLAWRWRQISDVVYARWAAVLLVVLGGAAVAGALT